MIADHRKKGPELGSARLVENADVVMADAATTEVVPEVGIANKIKADLRMPGYSKWVDKYTKFIHDPRLSSELKTLKDAEAHPIAFDQMNGEGSELYGCDVGDTEWFLGLYSFLEKFYIRDGYDALFEKIKTCWQNNETARVTLIGNEGTGKSWFQVYVLRELLRDRNGYKYIIRQVGKIIYLIDLEQITGYVWSFTDGDSIILNEVQHAVYLYEPALEQEQPPMGLPKLPSLATLSPYSKRIAEYKKAQYTELYFWPWTFSAMAAVAKDSKRTTINLVERYKKFGGIIRHVLAEDITLASSELTEKLANVSVSVLQNKALNIDREETGHNVSGYILCYNNKQEDEFRFTRKLLEFTSPEVESKVQEIIDALPLKAKAKTVLDRLNDQVVDLSGKNLEAVGTAMLSEGSHGTVYKWQSKVVGGHGDWSTFRTTKRTVVRLYSGSVLLQKQDQILVSTNTNFPLGDIVFTPKNFAGPIDVVQFTWQPSHPFTIRAMYDLRVNRLMVGHNVCVKLYIISPGMEDGYAGMSKIDFLKGSLSETFKWSSTSAALQPGVLQEMWNSTQVHVIRPVQDWKILLGNYITTL